MGLFDDRAVRVREVRPQVPASGLMGDANAGYLVEPLTPMDGSQLVAAGATFDYIFRGTRKLVAIDFDVPEDVSFDVELDGRVIASGRDLGGLIGPLHLGNDAGTRYTKAEIVRIVGVNAADTARDVRVWLRSIP